MKSMSNVVVTDFTYEDNLCQLSVKLKKTEGTDQEELQ
jgi:hypothetical protein